MMRLTSILVLLTLGSVASGSFAQSIETGSIIPKTNAATIDKDGTIKGDLARRVADTYATCIVGRHYKAVLKVLDLPIYTKERAVAFNNLMDRECLNNGQLSFSSNGIQGSLYRALFKRDISLKPLLTNAQPLDFTKLEMTATGWNFHSPAAGILNFAGCVIRQDKDNSKELILSQAGSKDEANTIKALQPAMDKCVDADQQLSFGKEILAAAVAEAFYREVQAYSPSGKP